MWSLQMLGGMAYVAGMAVMLVNHARTWLKRARPYAVPFIMWSLAKNESDGQPGASQCPGRCSVELRQESGCLDEIELASRTECTAKLGIFVALAVLLAFIIEVVPVFVFPNANAPKNCDRSPL